MASLLCRRAALFRFRAPIKLTPTLFKKPFTQRYFHASRPLMSPNDNKTKFEIEMMLKSFKETYNLLPAAQVEGFSKIVHNNPEKALESLLMMIQIIGTKYGLTVSDRTKKLIQESYNDVLKSKERMEGKLAGKDIFLRAFELAAKRSTEDEVDTTFTSVPPKEETDAQKKSREALEKVIEKYVEENPLPHVPLPPDVIIASPPPPADSTSSTSQTSTPPPPPTPTTSSSSTSSSTTESSPSTPPQDKPPKKIPSFPWKKEIDVDGLEKPKWIPSIVGLWFRAAYSNFSEGLNFWPSRLVVGAKQAVESFVEKLNEGDLPALRDMLSGPLYDYFESILQIYKENNLKLVLNVKPIEHAFVTDYKVAQQFCLDNREALCGVIPGTGADLQSLQKVAYRQKTRVGYALWQDIEKDRPALQFSPDMVTQGKAFVQFSVFVYCNEISFTAFAFALQNHNL